MDICLSLSQLTQRTQSLKQRPVALYGMPYQIDRIMAIANSYEIPVIEDAAEGLGSRFNGQVLGTFGKYGVASSWSLLLGTNISNTVWLESTILN